MSEPYTPSIAAVREVWLAAARRAPGQGEAFDRAVAAHDREVAAKALRDAADEMYAEYETRTAKSGSYGQMKIRAALRTASGMCSARADRIEMSGLTDEGLDAIREMHAERLRRYHDPRCISLTDSEYNASCDCLTFLTIEQNRAEKAEAQVQAVRALADERAASSCIHVTDLAIDLRAALDTGSAP